MLLESLYIPLSIGTIRTNLWLGIVWAKIQNFTKKWLLLAILLLPGEQSPPPPTGEEDNHRLKVILTGAQLYQFKMKVIKLYNNHVCMYQFLTLE